MKYARLSTTAACVLGFAAFSHVALAAHAIRSTTMIDFVGTLDIPEVAMAILARAALLSLLTVSIYLVARRGFHHPTFLVWLLPITGAIVLVCLSPWEIEYTIARALILASHPQWGSVGFFSWPPMWLAPSIGFPAGVCISGILWFCEICSTSRPTTPLR